MQKFSTSMMLQSSKRSIKNSRMRINLEKTSSLIQKKSKFESANVSQERNPSDPAMNLDISAAANCFAAEDAEVCQTTEEAQRVSSLDGRLPNVPTSRSKLDQSLTSVAQSLQLSQIKSNHENFKNESMKLKEHKLRAVKPTSVLEEQEAFRAQLAAKLEKGIMTLQA